MFSRSDELSRLFWILTVALAAVVVSELSTLILLLAFPLVVILSDVRLFLAVFRKHWKVVLLLPSCLLIFHYGTQTLSHGSINSSAIVPAARMFIVVLLSLAFVDITDPRRLAEGMNRLGLPHKWAFAVYLALRYVEILRVTARDTTDSIKLRMRGRRQQLWGRVLLFGRFVLLLVVSSLVRAEQTTFALQTRGFEVSTKRTFIRRHQWNSYGIILCMLMGIWIGTLLSCRQTACHFGIERLWSSAEVTLGLARNL